MRTLLKGIGAEIDDHRPAGDLANARGNVALLRGEVDLPVLIANRVELSALTEVDDLFARRGVDLAFEERQEVVAVKMYLELLVAGLIALCQLLFDVWHTGRRQQRWATSPLAT